MSAWEVIVVFVLTSVSWAVLFTVALMWLSERVGERLGEASSDLLWLLERLAEERER